MVITPPVPCYLGSRTLEVRCICWKDQGIRVMICGLMHNWEVASIGIYGVGIAAIRVFICFPLETNARRSLCVIRLSPTESSASKVHLEQTIFIKALIRSDFLAGGRNTRPVLALQSLLELHLAPQCNGLLLPKKGLSGEREIQSARFCQCRSDSQKGALRHRCDFP